MPVLEQPADVLQQFCRGDLDAFGALFRQYQSEVYGWIVRIVRDPATAEDSRLRPSGGSIARMPALIPHAISGLGRVASLLTSRSIT